MAELRQRSGAELGAISDEELIERAIAARTRGDGAGAREAIGRLAFGYWDHVSARVRLKIGDPESAEDVTMEVMESAIRSRFDGRHVGQFVSWLNTITRYRIADHYRDREGRPDQLSLDRAAGDDRPPPEPAVDPESDLVAYRELAVGLLGSRSPLHQRVIRLYGPVELGFDGLDASETVRFLSGLGDGETTTEANVHQIWSRFRREMEEALNEAGQVSGG